MRCVAILVLKPALTCGAVANALAIKISDKCDKIEPRSFKGLSGLYGLKRRTQDFGDTSAEIKAYVKSRDE